MWPKCIECRLARWTVLAVAFRFAAIGAVGAEEPIGFNRDVLPILADQCFACHGLDSAKREAGLRLDRRDAAVEKLPSGATAIVPGDLEQSELIRRILSDNPATRMPPPESGRTLSAGQKETLQRWIEQGSLFERHWAYVPPRRVEPPSVAGAAHPIDRFVLARLASEGMEPSPLADQWTQLRRVTLDLTGLPPSPLEVDAFLHDPRPDAYARVVDRLLASEHFGERWARWWLDLAHYGDSDGYLQDFLRPVAWRWRQWTVEAFNRDLPFDQFTIEQIAGDLLPGATESQRMATGFWRNTLSNREGGADLEEFRVAQTLDRVKTFGTTWLALTTGCAQCHDHKFDAISQREYYQLYAFFNNADEANLNAPLPGEREAYDAAKPEYDRRRAEILAPIAAPLAELQADWERQLLHAEAHPEDDFAWERTLELFGLQWGQDLGEGQLEGLGIVKTPREKRTQEQQDRLLDYFLHAPPAVYADKFKELQLAEVTTKLDALAKTLPKITRAPGMIKTPFRRPTYVHLRGEFRRPGEEVAPATPVALPPLPAAAGDSEVDRLTLARWLVASDHPLTARVVVNRLWQELFGRGIVGTSENFGVRGDRPSHPELLDWLAVELMEGPSVPGSPALSNAAPWSLKRLLRRIVTSDAYRRSSAARPDLATRDPANVLVARQTRLRLSGEAVRDSALSASGLLNRTVGGPSVKPPQPASVSKEAYRNAWEPSPGADRYRRGLYTFIQRTTPYAQFVTFDLPDASQSCTRRERSNTPLQALNLLNDPVFLEAARALAVRVAREVPGSDAAKLEQAYVLTLARVPTTEESARALALLETQRQIFAGDPSSARELLEESPPGTDPAWVVMASVLLNLDEFIVRE